MPQSATPHLDRWQDLHAQACKAEHDLLMAALGYLSGGGQPPVRDQAALARTLRDRACNSFDNAIDELFAMIESSTLRSRL